MKDEEDIPTSDDLGRAYMVTGGRVHVENSDLLPFETLVHPTKKGLSVANKSEFEKGLLLKNLKDSKSIAEISTQFKIPLITAQVLVTDMTLEGLLEAAEVVETIDKNMLLMIRQKVSSL